MYKVFINNSVILFQDSDQEKLAYSGSIINPSKDELLAIIQKLETSSETHKILITSDNLEATWELFTSIYKLIIAAGGLVKNSTNETLMIYRNDKWDLPKGKVEEDEEIELAAVREVEEECGITNLKIVHQLLSTYHTYFMKEQRILKRTDWYSMKTDYNKQLTPQVEEGITAVAWVKKDKISELLKNSFGSIIDVFENTDN